MEAEGSSSRALASGGDGPLQPPWKPNWRPELRANLLLDYRNYNCGGSSSTSTPGTALSSPYTNTSGGFTPQSSDGFDPVLLDLSWWVGEERGKNIEYIKCLFEEFCAANGDASVPERWLSEMGVSGRHVADDPSATSLLQFAGRWIQVLTDIVESIRNTYLTHTFSVLEERPVHAQLARFAEASILKMLPFVDAIVAPYFCNANSSVVGYGASAPAEKLRPLLGVREALSRASQGIRLSFCSTSSEEAKRITDKMARLLLTKEAKLDEAMWNTMEEVRTRLLASTEDDGSWWATQTPQGSPDIHKVTRAIISYINLLSTNHATALQIVDHAAQRLNFVPKFDNTCPLTSLIMETVSCLEEKLAKKSESFPDHSLRFLFLTNNSHFIWQQLYPTSVLEFHMSVLARKIDNYIETYLQVSWAPVLSCLYNSTPLCLGRYSSPAKFDSEFQKTYTAQKLWKVPDPKLRRRLRVAVIEKVISSFTKYLEYNNISPSRLTPQDLMDMLQELFEG